MLYKFAVIFVGFIYKCLFKLEVKNRPEKMDGPLIICANHYSNWDSLTMALSTKRTVHIMAKKELFSFKPFAFILRHLNAIEVDRKKGSDRKAIKKALSVLENGEALGIFPEGTRVKEADIANMKEGVGYFAIRGDAPIYVAHIYGDYKFRHKITFEYVKIIDYKEIEGERREVISEITKDIFYSMYQIDR